MAPYRNEVQPTMTRRKPDDDDDDDLCLVIASIAQSLLAIKYLYDELHAKPRVVRDILAIRGNVSFESVTSVYTDQTFRKAFRMSRPVFHKLLRKIRPDITKNIEMGLRSKRPVISPEVRLAITLRMLAGCSYLDLMMAFRIGGDSSIYRIFHDTCDALMKSLSLPGLPRTSDGLRSLSERFKTSRRRPSPLSGCVGAVDGISVRIKKPPANKRPATYYCRKGYYAVPVQALVDSNYKFLSYSARCVGATHDAMALMVSSLGKYLDSGSLQEEFWICGDEAYRCTESLISPYPISQCGESEKDFNYFLSSLRVHVEQAFGMLTARWRIVRDGLEFSVHRNTRIVCLCMKLHNFCIENGEHEIIRVLSAEERRQVDEETKKWYQDSKSVNREYNNSVGRGRPRARTASRKRDMLRDIVKDSGCTRPRLAWQMPQ